MLKRQTWRAALFLITLFASALGTFYPGAVAAMQCDEAAVDGIYRNYTGNYVDINLIGSPNLAGAELVFEFGPTIDEVLAITSSSNGQFIPVTLSSGQSPDIVFSQTLVGATHIRVKIVGTAPSNGTISVKACLASGTNIGEPTNENENEEGPTSPSGDPANQCSSSNIRSLILTGNPINWPLQAPLNVPAGSNIRLSFHSATDLEGFTLAWESPIDLNGAAVRVYNGGWQFPTLVGSNGRYQLSQSYSNATIIDFDISTSANGVLLGAEICPEVINVNTLMPVNQVGPVNPTDFTSGHCNRAFINGTVLENTQQGPQRLDKPATYWNNFGFDLTASPSATISGIEIDWIVGRSFNPGSIDVLVQPPGGQATFLNPKPTFTEVPVSSSPVSNVVRIVFDTPIQNVRYVVASPGIANPNDSKSMNSAKICEDWNSPKPTAAVLLGDSFASGEGDMASEFDYPGPGDYEPVLGWNTRNDPMVFFNMQNEDFPCIVSYSSNTGSFNEVFPCFDLHVFGTSGPTLQKPPNALAANPENAYFCHRSHNVQLYQANLPVDDRFNLACSGAWPRDFLISQPYYWRPNASGVLPQIEQLRRVADTHEIKLVQIMIGGNNTEFTFGGLLSTCIANFLSDAFFSDPQFTLQWVFQGEVLDISQKPCDPESLGIEETSVQTASANLSAAIAEVITTMQALYGPDHEYTLVMQNYPSPVGPTIDPYWVETDHNFGNDESDSTFRKLADHRYIGGCPIHEDALDVATELAAGLNHAIERVYEGLAEAFKDLAVDIRFSDLSGAFDGKRLCEDIDKSNDWFTPLRVMANGNITSQKYPQTIFHWNKLDLQQAADNCASHSQTCQESMHPNAKGHKKMAQCLNQTLALSSSASIEGKKNRCAPGDPPD